MPPPCWPTTRRSCSRSSPTASRSRMPPRPSGSPATSRRVRSGWCWSREGRGSVPRRRRRRRSHAALAQLTDVAGYQWGAMFEGAVRVTLPAGDRDLQFRFVYSRNAPHLEVIQAIPDTLWVPVDGSGIHHLGYWSDDLIADTATLQGRGYVTEAVGNLDSKPRFSFHRAATGPRIELVDRELQPGLEQLWATTLSSS